MPECRFQLDTFTQSNACTHRRRGESLGDLTNEIFRLGTRKHDHKPRIRAELTGCHQATCCELVAKTDGRAFAQPGAPGRTKTRIDAGKFQIDRLADFIGGIFSRPQPAGARTHIPDRAQTTDCRNQFHSSVIVSRFGKSVERIHSAFSCRSQPDERLLQAIASSLDETNVLSR